MTTKSTTEDVTLSIEVTTDSVDELIEQLERVKDTISGDMISCFARVQTFGATKRRRKKAPYESTHPTGSED